MVMVKVNDKVLYTESNNNFPATVMVVYGGYEYPVIDLSFLADGYLQVRNNVVHRDSQPMPTSSGFYICSHNIT